MSVVCFGSLKGGVGKTSLSVNVAHAFAQKGCEVLLIDLDPMAHASRLFNLAGGEAPLARLFLGSDLENHCGAGLTLVEAVIAARVPLVSPVRPRLALIPGGPELRHFFWGKGARFFREYFTPLIRELASSYDYIVIDTPPDFNILTRNSIAVSNVVLVPVDSSVMSIHGLEEIIASAAHIKGPSWGIVRTMVNRRASRMQEITQERLKDIDDPNYFIALLEQRERENRRRSRDEDHDDDRDDDREQSGDPMDRQDNPIYLLNPVIYRSEQQNRLSFLGKTAFDAKGSSDLQVQYAAVAREIENILAVDAPGDPLLDINENFALSLGLQ